MMVKSGDLYQYHSVEYEFNYIIKVSKNNIHYLHITFYSLDNKRIKIKHYIENLEYLKQFMSLRTKIRKKTFFNFVFKFSKSSIIYSLAL
jgi:hypothetical protein